MKSTLCAVGFTFDLHKKFLFGDFVTRKRNPHSAQGVETEADRVIQYKYSQKDLPGSYFFLAC